MMPQIEQKLDEILEKLAGIEKALNIVPDRETTITDFDSSVAAYEIFAKEDLKLEQITINNQKSAIQSFLDHSSGKINKETVKDYLDSNDSPSWKTNHTKALRRYVRDFLKLGRWMEDFDFAKARIKTKEVPSDKQIVEFLNSLPYEVQIIFLVLHNSGLRIGEVLSLRVCDIDFEKNMIDASNIHQGTTKSSWVSFITKQTSAFLQDYLQNSACDFSDQNSKLFSLSARSVQQAFKDASCELGFDLNPHLLRTVFAEKCTQAGIDKRYIEAFCGRTPKTILAKNYTDYSPNALRQQYDKVESFLTLGEVQQT
ncbi:MAG: site-specific integrase [Thaumarchaeota archaeon]|nr:site-specific integrase [Nitrososphaerota archaeon]MBI3641975.1 site-specific integrase [Nitrososphaerota archaeon]